jgi:hypothetical protein
LRIRNFCKPSLLTATRSLSSCDMNARPTSLWLCCSKERPKLSDIMLGRSYRKSIGKKPWRIRARIMLALLMVALVAFATNLYMVEEMLVVLLLLAVSTATILVFLIAFIPFHEGIRRTAAKTGLIRPANLSPQDPWGHWNRSDILFRNLLISPFKSRNRRRQVPGTSDASKTQSMLIRTAR